MRDADTGEKSLPDDPHSGGHRIAMAEVGSFCLAHCDCGWRGPARRARSLARRDGASHADGSV